MNYNPAMSKEENLVQVN